MDRQVAAVINPAGLRGEPRTIHCGNHKILLNVLIVTPKDQVHFKFKDTEVPLLSWDDCSLYRIECDRDFTPACSATTLKMPPK